MINAVGRDIPQEILDITGKEVFQGNLAKDGTIFKKHGPMVKAVLNNNGSKLVPSIAEVLKLCNAHDGMTISFHHHFREGDKVVNMVMDAIHEMGLKDITISASSLGPRPHRPLYRGRHHHQHPFLGRQRQDRRSHLQRQAERPGLHAQPRRPCQGPDDR